MSFPLHAAARNGDLTALTAQIGEGANLELRDPQASCWSCWVGGTVPTPKPCTLFPVLPDPFSPCAWNEH